MEREREGGREGREGGRDASPLKTIPPPRPTYTTVRNKLYLYELD